MTEATASARATHEEKGTGRMEFSVKKFDLLEELDSMLIVCLGWGPLIWEPRDLPLRGGWFADGPFLPIEFARQSIDGRITLVLVPRTFPLVRSFWKPMSVSTVKEARKTLGHRECEHKEKPETCADYWPRGCKTESVGRTVGKWAKGLQKLMR